MGDPAGLPSFSPQGECCDGNDSANSTQSACDPCSKPPSPPDSPAAERSLMDYPGCRRQSVIDSFGPMCDDSAAARRSSKERMRATLRSGSECQRSSALSEHGELLGASREVSREMSEPLVPSSPVASASRKSVSKESADLPQSNSLWNSCSGAVPSSARQGRQSLPQRCISAVEQPAENAGPLPSTFLSQLVVSSAGLQTVAASGDMPSQWNEVPDDILRTVFSHMPSAYVRVARLVCKVRTAPGCTCIYTSACFPVSHGGLTPFTT